MSLAAIVPCHNEENNIAEVLEQLQGRVDQIVVVDDGSTDRTAQVVRQSGFSNVTLLSNIINLGKGAAVRSGCDFAVEELRADLLVLVDGDGQHEPADVPRFVEAHEKHGADIVFGMRRRSRTMPPLMRLGNWFLTLASRILLGSTIYDTQCGYRLLTAQGYRKVRWESADYGMESEMIARAAASHLAHHELLIKTVYKDRYKGTTPMDGIKIFVRMLKWRLVQWRA